MIGARLRSSVVTSLEGLQFQEVGDFEANAQATRLLIDGIPSGHVLNRGADRLE